MEEKKDQKTFTEKEVMEIVSKLQNDYNKLKKEASTAIDQLNGTLTRLQFLFKVVENKTAFSENFVDYCVKEIEDIMVIKEDNANSEKQE